MITRSHKQAAGVALAIIIFSIVCADPLRVLGALTNTPFWSNSSRVHEVPFDDSYSYIILVPHIDDESLFAGATIAALADFTRKDPSRLKIVYTTTSTGGRPWLSLTEYSQARRDTLARVAKVLGLDQAQISIPEVLFDGSQQTLKEKYPGTLAWVRNQLGTLGPNTVIFTIGGNGQVDHSVAYSVGESLAREAGIPLYVYWGYGRPAYLTEKLKQSRFPQVESAILPISQEKEYRQKKTQALKLYDEMYKRNKWVKGTQNYYPDIIRYEWFHEDELGVVMPK